MAAPPKFKNEKDKAEQVQILIDLLGLFMKRGNEDVVFFDSFFEDHDYVGIGITDFVRQFRSAYLDRSIKNMDVAAKHLGKLKNLATSLKKEYLKEVQDLGSLGKRYELYLSCFDLEKCFVEAGSKATLDDSEIKVLRSLFWCLSVKEGNVITKTDLRLFGLGQKADGPHSTFILIDMLTDLFLNKKRLIKDEHYLHYRKLRASSLSN